MNTPDILDRLSDVGSTICDQAYDHIEVLQARIGELERIEFVAVPLGQSRVFADQEKRINELEAQLAAQAGLADILREAANIIAEIRMQYAPPNYRQPIIDELEGFAFMVGDSKQGS